jgi:uncharacterized protein YjbJ (UPF0337 family)
MSGKTQRAKGRVKESVGALTDDKGMKDRGRADQAAGTVRKTVGKAARKVRRAVD